MSAVWTDIACFAALAAVSLTVGLIVNTLRHQPLPLVYRSPQQRLQAITAQLRAGELPARMDVASTKSRAIDLDKFQAFAAARRGVVIDARSSFLYAQGHVPGAVNVSRAEFDSDYRRFRAQLDARKVGGIAVYCSGADCGDSDLVAEALAALGYPQIFIYREGWEEWSQSGLPQEK